MLLIFRLLKICLFASLASIAFAAEPSSPSLSNRYAAYSCAVARIETPHETGTGFFVDSKGTLVTAAHVIFDRSFIKQGSEYPLRLTPKTPLKIVLSDGQINNIPSLMLTKRDIENAIFDVAAIATNITPKCFIPVGTIDSIRIGDNLISIGFPASANSGVLYAGFLSSKHNQIPTVVGPVEGTPQVRMVRRDVMRIQMPITAGASGSPVIADDNTAIAIVSEIPVQWSNELSRLIKTMQNSPGGSGITLSGFDTTLILAQLALIVREFESPGAGLAVPISYLKLPPTNEPLKP